ncbi:hypothetical protein CMO87_01955 [Candidatus Woesearchaeota archaeon]|jgi:hypothetical protein|nr:hypothetical protein [Candidatus Woesearchaeota archaeon]|tara:strand:- start:401 stop:853 length:453 start_codon:yes stop_codon:yes gene_type:complete
MIPSIDMVVVSETNPEVSIKFKPTTDPTPKLEGVVESLQNYFTTQGMDMNRSPSQDNDGGLKYLVNGTSNGNVDGNVRIKHRSSSKVETSPDWDFPTAGTTRHQGDYTVYFNFSDDTSYGYAAGYASHISPVGSSHPVHHVGQDGAYTRY